MATWSTCQHSRTRTIARQPLRRSAAPQVIYLSRHGQSEYNVLGKIGGNPPLSEFGDTYAERLGKWVPDNVWRQDGQLVKVRPLPEWLADCGGWLVES